MDLRAGVGSRRGEAGTGRGDNARFGCRIEMNTYYGVLFCFVYVGVC